MAIAAANTPETDPIWQHQTGMQSVSDFLSYLSDFRHCSPATTTAYRGDITSFLTWCREQGIDASPSSLNRQTLFRFVTSLAHLRPNTTRRRLHALGSWFRYLIELGAMRSNPAHGLPLPRRERKLPHYPTADQVRSLLDAAIKPVERAVIWLLATAGLRRAELCDLDLDSLSADGTELCILGKGNRERIVPLPAQTQRILAEYIALRGDEPGPLILNRAGNRMGHTSLRRIFARLLRRAGLAEEGFSLHSMRHSYATMLVQAGVDLGTIRDLLGHSDISVTSIYLHSDLRSKRTAVERLPILGGGGDGDE